MDAAQATQLATDALVLALTLAAPVLAATFLVSLVGAAVQSVTQVQDPVVMVVPRIAAGLLALWLSVQWIGDRLGLFTADMLRVLSTLGA